MAVRSVYVPDPRIEEGRLRVRGEEHQHLRVARAEFGEEVDVFDGRGTVWRAHVDAVERRETVLRIGESCVVSRPSPELIVGLSAIKAAAWELAIEKLVEIGATRLVPVIAARCNIATVRRDRSERILIEAAKQSKRYHLPVLDEPIAFEAALDIPAATRIVFAERGGGPLKPAIARAPALCLIGPEGGWTAGELQAAETKGFALVGLGDGVLRAETAALVGAALIRYEFSRIG